jgi:trehalose-phosphatase
MHQRAKQGVPELSASRRRRVHDRIRHAVSLFVALDYDGTLVPIVARPELARPSEQTLAVLASLAGTPGIFVAVVSGRNLEVLRAFLPVPNLALAGLHGLEMWPQVDRPASRTDVHVVRADLDRLLAAVKERMSGQKLPRIEDKRHSVTFHYRGESRSAASRMRAAVKAAFGEMEAGASIVLVRGKQAMEARPAGVDKASSIRALYEQLAPGALPIVLGDDVTDEDLFAAFADDGVAVRVGRSSRKTHAHYALKNPAEVVDWLAEIEKLWRGKDQGTGS